MKSKAWDRYSVLFTLVFAFASVASVISLVEFFRGGYQLETAAGVLGHYVPPGLGVIAFVPLGLVSAKAAHPCLTITEDSIGGVGGNQTIPMDAITGWDIRESPRLGFLNLSGDVLVLWLPQGSVYRRAFRGFLRLGVPLGTVWAVVDHRVVPDLRQFLVARLGPPASEPSQPTPPAA